MKKLRLFAKKPVFAKLTPLPANESYDIATKRVILEIAGDSSTDPATLRESLKLKDNLYYGDNEYRLLQIRLNEYVQSKKKEASISTDDASGCTTVGDCVTLIGGKLS